MPTSFLTVARVVLVNYRLFSLEIRWQAIHPRADGEVKRSMYTFLGGSLGV